MRWQTSALALAATVGTLAATTVSARRASADRPSAIEYAPAVVYSLPHLPAVVVTAERPATRPAARAPKEHGRARARLARAREGEAVPVELTAYCLKGTTRRGRYVRPGIVAADPRVFPLSRFIDVFVDGDYYGRFLVDDTGSNIKGSRLDVWMASCQDAIRFGRVKGTAVLVPKGEGRG